MSVIVTGCAGFIGSHVTEEFLSAGYEVIGVDCLTYAGKRSNMSTFIENEKFTFHERNIIDTFYMEEIIKRRDDVDWIVNLAAETHVDNSIKDDMTFINTNILGVKFLLDVCISTGCKLLHFSTDEVYGVAENKPFTEESPVRPKNPYSATKAAGDHLIESYANTHGVEYTIVRPSNNFGPRQDAEKFLPTIMRNIKAGNRIPIYGDGKQIREWTYVKETAKATKHILENCSTGEIYNIGSEFYMKNIDLVEKVCDNINLDITKNIQFVEDRPGHDFKYSITSKKLNNTGFHLKNDFENQLKETIKEML